MITKRLLARIRALLGRALLVYLSRARGTDLSRSRFLPAPALLPLKRDGLDPVAELSRLREREPVSRLPLPFGMTVWLVTGYEPVRAVLSDTTAFSNDFTNLGALGISAERNPGGLGFADPPAHTRLRRMLTPEFTVYRLKALQPRILSIVDDQIRRLAAFGDEPVDLVAQFALPIPSLIICELLDVPYQDRADFQRLSMARFDLFGGTDSSLGAVSESLDYLRGLVARQRAAPSAGLLGRLVRKHGDQIDDEELAGIADGLLTGGFETTASMLALGALALLRDPVFAGRMRQDDSIDQAVEELLRYLTVVQVAFPRFARQATAIAGAKIEEGDVVLCSLSAADRDPFLGDDMDRLDPARPPTPHLAFGYGVHRCLGAELARMELKAAYSALVRAFPGMRLAILERDLSFRKLSLVHGLDALPVYLRPET